LASVWGSPFVVEGFRWVGGTRCAQVLRRPAPANHCCFRVDESSQRIRQLFQKSARRSPMQPTVMWCRGPSSIWRAQCLQGEGTAAVNVVGDRKGAKRNADASVKDAGTLSRGLTRDVEGGLECRLGRFRPIARGRVCRRASPWPINADCPSADSWRFRMYSRPHHGRPIRRPTRGLGGSKKKTLLHEKASAPGELVRGGDDESPTDHSCGTDSRGA